MRAKVVTLTLNPSIDASSVTHKIRPTHKVRTVKERMDPGGGGINVARVLTRFAVEVEAVFLAGGPTGALLDALLERQGVARRAVGIDEDTRISLTVHETSSGQEYRFVPEGPGVGAAQLEACFTAVEDSICGLFVASGSLPRGAPDDVYARVADRLGADVKLIVDTSGAELKQALGRGGIFLVKPSRGELEQLAGRPLATRDELIAEAGRIVAAGQARHVAVTLGRDGALLVNEGGAFFLAAVPVETQSAVGAGDAFLAGMTIGLIDDGDPLEAFRLGAAAGAATALTPGTDLCFPNDVNRLLAQVPRPERLD